MCLRIPPKYSVSYTIGLLKWKSAVRIHRWVPGSKKANGLNFWAGGYFVSTVGRDEAGVTRYIKKQEEIDLKIGQLEFFWSPSGDSRFNDRF